MAITNLNEIKFPESSEFWGTHYYHNGEWVFIKSEQSKREDASRKWLGKDKLFSSLFEESKNIKITIMENDNVVK